MNNLSTSEISQQFDTWLHNFFLERFGKKEPKEFNATCRKPKQHKGLALLRKRKKQCKAARKALIKAGMKGSPDVKLICREWFSRICQHNKLRTALQKHQQIKDRIKAEKSFRTNRTNLLLIFFNLNNKIALQHSLQKQKNKFSEHVQRFKL